MIKVTSLQGLSTLPITITLQDQLEAILTAPFHDETETQDAWNLATSVSVQA